MSKIITVQLYGQASNNAVIRMPDRQNPGVVIQADTLRALSDDAREIANQLKTSGVDAIVVSEANALAEQLREMFDHLESALAQSGEKINI